ncbi:MAG: hypothetical protein RJA57_1964 [Bacteroidota bacterium]
MPLIRIVPFLLVSLLWSPRSNAQTERDTVLTRCPVSITDTVTQNNYFVESRQATLKVYRVRGKLTIAVEQRDQLFSLFFHDRRLRTGTYDIVPGSRGSREVEGTYSFKSGDQAAYINFASGTIQVVYDKEKALWSLKVRGLLSTMGDRGLSYFRVKGDLLVK